MVHVYIDKFYSDVLHEGITKARDSSSILSKAVQSKTYIKRNEDFERHNGAESTYISKQAIHTDIELQNKHLHLPVRRCMVALQVRV